jgi:hypothetical protein
VEEPSVRNWIYTGNSGIHNGRRLGGTALETLRVSDPAKFASLTSTANYNPAVYQIIKSANTDWFAETFNPAPIQSHQISVSGGSDKATFLIGFNYSDQGNTAYKYRFYKRYTLRANSSFNINKNLRVGENLQIGFTKFRNVGNPGDAWVWTNTANFSKSIGKNAFKLLVGTEAINDLTKYVGAIRNSYQIEDYEPYLVMNAGTGSQSNSGSYYQSMLYSLFGRLDYTYADKLFINATLRWDGSSKFGPKTKYGYFPAVAVGWRISSENYMKNIKLMIVIVSPVKNHHTVRNKFKLFQKVLIMNFGSSNLYEPAYRLNGINQHMNFQSTFLFPNIFWIAAYSFQNIAE